MGLRQDLDAGRQRWRRLTVYLKFEHAVVLVLTILISVIIVSSFSGNMRWNFRSSTTLASKLLAPPRPGNGRY
jgi:hypothetical protein